MRRQFFAILIVLLAGCRKHTPTGQLAPLGEVKAGMTGYCLSEYEDGMDRLLYTVVGVEKDHDGFNTRIVIRFTKADNGHSLTGNGVPSGMSGSPMYLDDGRLIGALAESADDPDYTVWVTPIQEMLDLAKRITPSKSTGNVPTPEPGTFVATCVLWGDANVCTYGTITIVRDGLAFAFGHADEALTTEPDQEAAVFLNSVLTTVQTTNGGRYPGDIGQPLGTMVYNGEAGGVIDLRRAVQEFPVNLTFTDDTEKTYHLLGARQNGKTTDALTLALVGLTTRDLNTAIPHQAEVKITLKGTRGTLIIRDSWGPALAATIDFLKRLLTQTPQDLDRVDIVVTKATNRETYTVVGVTLAKYGGLLPQAGVTLTRTSDNQRTVVYELFALPKSEVAASAWATGRALQSEILNRVPAASALTLLNQFTDRESLYLACADCEATPPPGQGTDPIELAPPRILGRLYLGGRRLVGTEPIAFEALQEVQKK